MNIEFELSQKLDKEKRLLKAEFEPVNLLHRNLIHPSVSGIT